MLCDACHQQVMHLCALKQVADVLWKLEPFPTTIGDSFPTNVKYESRCAGEVPKQARMETVLAASLVGLGGIGCLLHSSAGFACGLAFFDGSAMPPRMSCHYEPPTQYKVLSPLMRIRF